MNTLAFPELISRMIQQESGGNPNAVSGVGASGLMQVMPATAADPGYGVRPMAWENRFDPAENKRFGSEYMQAMLAKYNGDQPRALAAYNWGVGNADGWDGNMTSLPAETQNYIASILGGRISGPMETSPQPVPRPEVGALLSSPRPMPRPAIAVPQPASETDFDRLVAAIQAQQQEKLNRAAKIGVNLAQY